MRQFLYMLAILVSATPKAFAQEDALDRIPTIAPLTQEKPARARVLSGSAYAGNAVEYFSTRDSLPVNLPVSATPDWLDKAFLDGRASVRINTRLRVVVSDRFSAIAQLHEKLPVDGDYRNDLREAYVEWRPAPSLAFEAGRVNVRYGVGYAFAPTDFLRSRAIADTLSSDPSAQRTDRLGVFMLRGEYFFSRGAVDVLYAPKLADPTPLLTSASTFNLGAGRTNGADRVIASAHYSIARDFDPQFVAYYDGNRWSGGVSITHALGDNITLYAEWAGGKAASLFSRAFSFGVDTGTFPDSVLQLSVGNDDTTFRNAVSAGFSYQTANKINLIVEYNYYGGGFSSYDWAQWFASGMQTNLNGELWYVRDFARDQTIPLSRNRVFIRLARDDAFLKNITLSAFALVNAGDGSVVGQFEADYKFSQKWSATFIAQTYTGATHSEYGSLPIASSAILSLQRSF
ncbi:MAG: hypothetical protein R3C60_02330 [Parvularculaceae bacterium]